MRLDHCSFLIGSSLAAPAAQADVIFSNLISSSTIGWTITGFSIPSESVAAAFTPTGDYDLTGAEAWLIGDHGGGTIDFALYSNSGSLPGTLLASLGSATVGPTDNGVFTAGGPIPSGVLLSSGVEYWLVLTPGTSSTFALWGEGGSSSVPVAFTTDTTGASGWTGANADNLQFELTGTPAATTVPEPASAILLLSLLILLTAIPARRLRREH